MERRDGTMLRKVFSIFSLFIIPAVVLTTPLAVQSDPVDPEDVARMKSGHQKVEGVGDRDKVRSLYRQDVLPGPRSR